MAIAVVNSSAIQTGSGIDPVPFALGFTPTAGNLLTIHGESNSATTLPTGFSQTNGTWLGGESDTTGRYTWNAYGSQQASPGTTVTVDKASATAGNYNMVAVELSGLPTSGAFNAAASSCATGTGTAATTNSVTPTAGRDVIAFVITTGSGTPPATPTDWTAAPSMGAGDSPKLFYRIYPNIAGSIQETFTWGTSAAWKAHIFCFETAAGPVTTCNMVSEPSISVLSGEAFTVTAEQLLDGVRDTSFTGNVVLSKQSGNGTLAGVGTSLTVAAVSGLATWNVSITEAAGTALDQHVLRATLPTTETDDTAGLRIRNSGLNVLGDYSAVASMVEGRSGTNGVVYYGRFTPADPAPAGGYPVIFCLGGSSEAYSNLVWGTPELAIANAQTNMPMGDWCDDHKSTFPLVKIDLLIGGIGDETAKTQWRSAFAGVLDQIEADGVPINRRKVGYNGWSTGGIESSDVKREYEGERVFAYYITNDGSFRSDHMTANGSGPPHGVYDGSYDDPTFADTVLMPLMGTDWVNDGASMLIMHGTQTNIAGASGRDSADIKDFSGTSVFSGMVARLSALGLPAMVDNTTTNVLVLDPSTKRQYTKSTTLDHPGMKAFPYTTGTNGDTLLAWILNQEWPASGTGTGTGYGSRRVRARRLIAAEAA